MVFELSETNRKRLAHRPKSFFKNDLQIAENAHSVAAYQYLKRGIYLIDLVTDEDYRRQGYASRLLDELPHPIVCVSNRALAPFYLANHFTLMSVQDNDSLLWIRLTLDQGDKSSAIK